LRRSGQVEQTEHEASWDLARSRKVPLAVSMPSAEYHRRVLRDYDALEAFTVRYTGRGVVDKDRERD
jgi:hypothetical protein